MAMEARCHVGGRGQTRLAKLELKPLDWLALSAVAAYTALMLAFSFPV